MTALTNVQTYVVSIPDSSPATGIDLFSDTLSWRDIYPSNFWNLDLLDEKIEALGGNPVYTPARIVVQPVVDPELPEEAQDRSPKLVLEFEESVPALVLNKTRCLLMSKLAGSPNPQHWIERLGGARLELYAGAYRDMASAMQILIRPVVGAGEGKPAANGNGKSADVGQANAELFGE